MVERPHCFHLQASHATLIIPGSDVVHVDVLGTHMVIVNSTRAAKELFDKRSSIYSDRYFKTRAAANFLAISDCSQASFGSVELHVSPLSAYVFFLELCKNGIQWQPENGLGNRLHPLRRSLAQSPPRAPRALPPSGLKGVPYA
jgi:hypothetical protein